MSYDLVVFEVQAAPREAGAFDRWFQEQTAWDGARTYADPDVTTPRLRAWLEEMTRAFPATSESAGGPAKDDARVADYVIGPALVYVAFAWTQADSARRHAVELAAKHGVGFLDTTGDVGPIWSADELQRQAEELAEAAEDEAEAEASGRGVTGYRRSNAQMRWLVTGLAVVSVAICGALFTGTISAPKGTNPVVGKVAMTAGALFWTALAVGNWMEWWRTRRMWDDWQA